MRRRKLDCRHLDFPEVPAEKGNIYLVGNPAALSLIFKEGGPVVLRPMVSHGLPFTLIVSRISNIGAK
jgi:hypothetical protein